MSDIDLLQIPWQEKTYVYCQLYKFVNKFAGYMSQDLSIFWKKLKTNIEGGMTREQAVQCKKIINSPANSDDFMMMMRKLEFWSRKYRKRSIIL